ncbi:MAG: NAD(P)-binding protein [Cyanobacteria bacterium P01_H01_bin.15]
MTDCLIIGGGLAGLLAAKRLQIQNLTVKVVDKGLGIGGRLASRRITPPELGKGTFDYGAPFFRGQSRAFKQLLSDWEQTCAIAKWPIEPETYRGIPSNRSLAQFLAQDCDVHNQTRVTRFTAQAQGGWRVETEDGRLFSAQALVLTPPVPQTLELVQNSNIELESTQLSALTDVQYEPCITVLALLAIPNALPESGWLSFEDHPCLKHLVCNQKKGVSPDAIAVTIYARADFSQAHLKDDLNEVANTLLIAAEPYLRSQIVDFQVHRWRYAQTHKPCPYPYLEIPAPATLIIGGDGFGDPAISSLARAALSGLAIAERLTG